MPTLYIIGNGFDLYHGLNTRYSDFHKYIGEHYIDLENELEEYFHLSIDSEYLWKNFEAELCRFNNRQFFDDNNHIDVTSETFKLSQTYSLEDEISQLAEELVDDIREAFEGWINSIEFPEHFSLVDRPLYLDTGARFINFNYTDTLTEFYSVPKSQILHIHGNATELEELIFGHGQQDEDQPRVDELDSNGESTRTMFSDSENAARAPFYALKKDTAEVLEMHRSFFLGLQNIDKIYVLGHSIGEVDYSYFIEIRKLAPGASWYISFHHDTEKAELEQIAMQHIGIDQVNITMIRIVSLEIVA